MKLFSAVFVLAILAGTSALAQNTNSENQKVPFISEAYTVLAKEKAKCAGDIYEAKQRFTPESIQFRTALLRATILNDEIKKLSGITTGNSARLTAAYGNLILAKIQTEVELFELRQTNTPESIAFKRKRIELDSLDNDLRQINESFR